MTVTQRPFRMHFVLESNIDRFTVTSADGGACVHIRLDATGFEKREPAFVVVVVVVSLPSRSRLLSERNRWKTQTFQRSRRGGRRGAVAMAFTVPYRAKPLRRASRKSWLSLNVARGQKRP